ncbi:uncharacterized protein LOC62_02G002255 [Vanrija pseudolonga]|uniref:Uncharacterized protein n=1 Tax=Vanrija pseudolonga TaxID=143232 RepID=A0AAF1BFV7_9TREE|nr:hypothetical protein LOC62_02G002255 [Vanrija pseudolonga]
MYGSDEFGGGFGSVGVVAAPHPGPSPSFMVFDAPRERERHAQTPTEVTHRPLLLLLWWYAPG